MAAKATALSLLLIVSLLSASTTKTLATFINPLTIPSCCNHRNAKCYADYKAVYTAKSAAGLSFTASGIPIALNAVYAAKASCSAALVFFNIMKSFMNSQGAVTCTYTFNIAIESLDQASMAMQGKTDMSKSVAIEVQRNVTIAAQSVLNCTVSSKSPQLKSIAAEPMKLCDIAVSFCKQMAYH